MKHMDRAESIAGLTEDPAHEYASVVQYRTFASMVRGPHRPTLLPLFASWIADEFEHVGLLAGAIVALGGEQTTVPAPVPLVAGRSRYVHRSSGFHQRIGRCGCAIFQRPSDPCDAVPMPARKGAQPAPAGYGGDA